MRPAEKQARTKPQAQVAQGAPLSVVVPGEMKSVVVGVFRWDESARGSSSDAATDQPKHGSGVTEKEPEASKTLAPTNPQASGNVSPAPNVDLDKGISNSVQLPNESLPVGFDLSAAGEVSGTQDVISSGSVTSVAASSSMDTTGVMKTAGVADNPKNAATGTADAASHSPAGGAQVQPSPQIDGSKPVMTAPKSGDAPATTTTLNASSVAASGAMHGAAHEVQDTPRAAGGAASAPHAAKAQELAASAHMAGDEEVRGSGINTAKLMQTMGETEMHVGMHSEEFGDISIRTAISQQQMVAQISLDHNGLSQAITNHVLDVQTKLSEEYGLRASIQVNQQTAPFSGDNGGSSQGETNSQRRSARGTSAEPIALTESGGSMGAIVASIEGRGLDVRV